MNSLIIKKKTRRIIRFVKSRFEFVPKEKRNYLKEIEKNFPRVLSTSETLDYIINNKVSIARYGDAEFDICNKENENDTYQRPSDELTRRLSEILDSNLENIVICIPPFNSKYNNIKNYYGCLSFWEKYWIERFEKIGPLLKRGEYGNSFISRDAVFYENSIERIKLIWNQRKVVFVYGKGGRFNENHILFDNISEFKHILIPAQNAFDEYNIIINECLKEDKDSLFLIAAGPTACVLAYDLACNGYQALDIGHIPNCYDQYMGIIQSPEALPLNSGQ